MNDLGISLLIGILVYIAVVLRDIRHELKKTQNVIGRLDSNLSQIEGHLAPKPVAPYKTTSQPLSLPK